MSGPAGDGGSLMYNVVGGVLLARVRRRASGHALGRKLSMELNY
jgi:hypothetical protein